MTFHDAMREIVEKFAHTAAVVTGFTGSLYSMFLDNPIGFLCAIAALTSCGVNWYYKRQDNRRAEERHSRDAMSEVE